MKQLESKFTYLSSNLDELDDNDRYLVELACAASRDGYEPYSQFLVGAALRLEDDTIVTGNNQENASYPCGLCAERTALFHAHAIHPHFAPRVIAIAAQTGGHFTAHPLPPCGACRQALLEMEQKFGQPLRLILHGENENIIVEKVSDLIPLLFDSDMLSD